MIIVYIVAACLIVYGFLFGFRQMQSLQERISRLESEKQEMETLLLSFMESMNDIVTKDATTRKEERVTARKPVAQPEVETVAAAAEMNEKTEVMPKDASDGLDVEDVLLRHSVRDAARLLGKGEGEMALYAKLRKK